MLYKNVVALLVISMFNLNNTSVPLSNGSVTVTQAQQVGIMALYRILIQISKIIDKIGYRDGMLDDDKMDKFYSAVRFKKHCIIKVNNVFRNMIMIRFSV